MAAGCANIRPLRLRVRDLRSECKPLELIIRRLRRPSKFPTVRWGELRMRVPSVCIMLLLCIVLTACAASRQEVAARLGAQFVGQNIDEMVIKFGPPTSTFKMNSGQSSYVWQLTAITDIAGDRGFAQAQSRFCKVSVIASPLGVVTQLNTEDSNAGAGLYAAVGAFGSICAQRLGMKPQS